MPSTPRDTGERERIARQIALTSESIRKKHRALKTGQMEEEVTLEKRLKPLIEPLRQIAGNTQSSAAKSTSMGNTFVKKENKENYDDIDEFKTPRPRKSAVERLRMPSTSSELSLASPEVRSSPFDEETYEHVPTLSPMQRILHSPGTREKLLDQLGVLGRKYVGILLSNDKSIDNVYGVYYDDQGMMLGDKRFDLSPNDDIIVGDKTFRGNPGLYELIFKKVPDENSYSRSDLQEYRNILLLTNAHKRGRGRDPNLPIMANKGYKYKKIIGKLLGASKKKIGVGNIPRDMTVTNDAVEYIHWDDPNELVDRLRLLDASRQAGNNAHDNEFLSIIEELREAGLIVN